MEDVRDRVFGSRAGVTVGYSTPDFTNWCCHDETEDIISCITRAELHVALPGVAEAVGMSL